MENHLENLSEEVQHEFEAAWGNVFQIVNNFLKAHDQFGFSLIAQKIHPSIEDMLLSLKMMGVILNFLGGHPDVDLRMLLNAKQQILLFEQASLALQTQNKADYDKLVIQMRAQAQF